MGEAGGALRYSAVLYGTVQYGTVQYGSRTGPDGHGRTICVLPIVRARGGGGC